MSTHRPLLNRMYDWVLHWAGHPRAQVALFLVSFAEASFFPIPPDVLLMAMCMSKPSRWLRYAVITAVGSLLGGSFGYLLGSAFWSVLSDSFFHWLGPIGFTQERFELVQGLYREHAFLAVFSAGFSPIPYKIFTIGAGVFGVKLEIC